MGGRVTRDFLRFVDDLRGELEVAPGFLQPGEDFVQAVVGDAVSLQGGELRGIGERGDGGDGRRGLTGTQRRGEQQREENGGPSPGGLAGVEGPDGWPGATRLGIFSIHAAVVLGFAWRGEQAGGAVASARLCPGKTTRFAAERAGFLEKRAGFFRAVASGSPGLRVSYYLNAAPHSHPLACIHERRNSIA